MKKLNNEGFTPLMTIGLIVLVLIIGTTGWYVYNKNKTTDNTIKTSSTVKQGLENDNQPTVESIAKSVIVTQGADSEQKTVQTSLKDFYKDYVKNPNATKLLDENLTAKAHAYVNEGHPYTPLICAQYVPMLVVGIPSISGISATVVVQPIDLIDLYAEKPYTISLIKQNSKWLIDAVNCST